MWSTADEIRMKQAAYYSSPEYARMVTAVAQFNGWLIDGWLIDRAYWQTLRSIVPLPMPARFYNSH